MSRESADPDDSGASAVFERESNSVDVREIDYQEGPLAKGNSKCTDPCCFLAFIIFWLGNFGASLLQWICRNNELGTARLSV